MAGLLYWIALACTGVPNKEATECIYTLEILKHQNILTNHHDYYNSKLTS